jgi:eukaryotic-like serine/threonine-protein kinase
MQCLSCKFDNPANAERCRQCGAGLNGDATLTRVPADLAPTMTHGPVAGWSAPAGRVERVTGILEPGTLFGERYEILQILGVGGMGAVYKARDLELDRLVAIKVIRPDLGSNQDILDRFKRELILARAITHKNVIRIFDLGQADGVKFITMEFVEGRDLHTLIGVQHPFTIQEKVNIIKQVCRALEAAHAEGVVHRDLKPHNIMLENSGRVLVMDFGIARSIEEAGVTMTGALIGTPAYMSPEQAKGEKTDTRSDLFSLGIVFYVLLTGEAPYEADTAMGLLLKRIQERPIPPIDRKAGTPKALSDVVVKMLEVDRDQRYQTAAEIIRDLDGWLASPDTFVTGAMPSPPRDTSLDATVTQLNPAPAQGRLGMATDHRVIVTPEIAMMSRSSARKWITISLAVAVVLTAGIVWAFRIFSTPDAPQALVTVMIGDINNRTGDPVFDGTLEPILKIALEGAGFISAYDRSQLRTLGVRQAPAKLDEVAARQIAVSQGLGVVISGSLDRKPGGFGLSLKVGEAVTGNQLAIVDGEASNKDQVLSTITSLAASVRKALGDHTSESAQRFAMETLSASSLEAVHEYSIAMNALANSKNAEALASFSKAVDLDPNFGLAYAGKAVASKSLGKQQEAEAHIKEALTHIDRMTERERYRTRGMFYTITGNYEKCGEEYSALVARYRFDVSAHNNLGVCYGYLRNFAKTAEETRKASEILPKRALYRFNLGAYEVLSGDFAAAERDVRSALKLEPAHEKGHLILAVAQSGQNQLAAAAETYKKLKGLSALGASYAASGLGDLAVYEGRFNDAIRILNAGAAADLAAKQPGRAAEKFAPIAYAHLLLGQKGPALAAADRALANSTEPKVRLLAALIFAGLGADAKARALAESLKLEFQIEPRAFAKLIEGELALQSGAAREAIKIFTEANALLDTWLGRFGLGRAYLEAGAFAEADSEFDRCIKRRGEAMLLFVDAVPTLGYFPAVYYYQARVREGMKTSGFADSYRAYLKIRETAGEDPLLTEIRKRIAR